MCPEYGNRHPQPPCFICCYMVIFKAEYAVNTFNICLISLAYFLCQRSLSFNQAKVFAFPFPRVSFLHASKVFTLRDLTSLYCALTLWVLINSVDLKSLLLLSNHASLQPLRAPHKSACARAHLRSFINKTTARFFTKSAVATKRDTQKWFR